MGVPQYFNSLRKRYPHILYFNSEQHVDNLFFDYNSLIHPIAKKCLEGKEDYGIDELEKCIINDVLEYTYNIIKMVNPSFTLIAVDGSAPRAKMQQQRSRRFMKVKLEKIFKDIYAKYNVERKSIWNSNAITPGTYFMKKLMDAIEESIKVGKLKDLNVTLNSSYQAGEGEHKIMYYIKKNSKDNEINCIYGLDADLIFLSLGLHKSNIILLREHENDNFKYFSIDFLKDALIREHHWEKYNVKNVINDYIFLYFFAGNDFIKHIPSISIDNCYLLLECYNSILQSLFEYNQDYDNNNKYLVFHSKLNQKFLTRLLYLLTKKERISLQKIQENKRCSRPSTDESPWKRDEQDATFIRMDNDLNPLHETYKNELDNIDYTNSNWKELYYEQFFNVTKENINYYNAHRSQICEQYMESLLWSLKYYQGYCASWSWFYTYRAAPPISDLFYYCKNNNINDIYFRPDKPFHPVEQLLLVLPPQDHYLVPKKIRSLMYNNSPLKEFYPENVKIDFKCTNLLWKATPLLPILDGQQIKDYYFSCKKNNQ